MHASVGIAIPKSHLALCKASMFCRQMKFGPGIFLTQVCLSSAPNVGQSCSVLAKMAPLKVWLSSAHKEDSCAAQGFRSLPPPPLPLCGKCQQLQLSVTAAGYCSIYKFTLAPGGEA